MYYTNNDIKIKTNMTHLNGSQIFNGTYWDEFGIAHACLPEDANVLILGSAEGGCIRPLLSTNRVKKLTCIDIDERSIEKCEQFFSRNFPELKFHSICMDANDFLESSNESYDFIIVDLYSNTGYIPSYFQDVFWNNISNKLAVDSTLFINSFGIPNHLNPFEGSGPQQNFLQYLKTNFKNIKYIPYRRNLSILIEKGHREINRKVPNLKFCDQIIIKCLILKYQYRENLPAISSHNISFQENSFQSIDRQMKLKWGEICKLLNQYNKKLNTKYPPIERPIEIRSFFKNHRNALSVLNLMVEEKNKKIIFFPIFLAGEINCSNIEIDWFLEWFFLNYKLIDKYFPREYIQFFLPQISSIIISPNHLYKKYIFQMNTILNSKGNI